MGRLNDQNNGKPIDIGTALGLLFLALTVMGGMADTAGKSLKRTGLRALFALVLVASGVVIGYLVFT